MSFVYRGLQQIPYIKHCLVSVFWLDYPKLELSENLTIPPLKRFQSIWLVSLTKNVERKKIKGRTNRRMSIFNPTSQLVVVNLYTKFEVSILNGCKDICDEKSGEKEKRTNIGKNK